MFCCARAAATSRIIQTRFLIADLEAISSESLIRTGFLNMDSKRGTRCASSHEPNDKKPLITNAHTLYIHIPMYYYRFCNHTVLSFRNRIVDAGHRLWKQHGIHCKSISNDLYLRIRFSIKFYM